MKTKLMQDLINERIDQSRQAIKNLQEKLQQEIKYCKNLQSLLEEDTVKNEKS